MNWLCRVKDAGKPLGERAQGRALVTVLAFALSLVVLVVLAGMSAVAQEGDGARTPESQAGPRRAAERESQRGPVEADGGPRRPAEGAGARRLVDGKRGVDPPAEGQSRGEVGGALRGFRPQTQREAALFQMIAQLQREVAALRREIQSPNGERRSASAFGNANGNGNGNGNANANGNLVANDAEQFSLPARWRTTKEGRVFLAYDKNKDGIVSLEEWLAMTNGNISPARREISTKHFNDAEPSGDGKFTPAEFIWWRQVGSRQATQRAQQDRARSGDSQ